MISYLSITISPTKVPNISNTGQILLYNNSCKSIHLKTKNYFMHGLNSETIVSPFLLFNYTVSKVNGKIQVPLTQQLSFYCFLVNCWYSANLKTIQEGRHVEGRGHLLAFTIKKCEHFLKGKSTICLYLNVVPIYWPDSAFGIRKSFLTRSSLSQTRKIHLRVKFSWFVY